MRSHRVFFAAAALAVSGGFALSSGPVLAQQSNDPGNQASNAPPEEITVVAPRVIRTKVRDPNARGVGYYDMLTLSHQVSYADLHLAHPGDAKTLKDRIAKAASVICQELASVRPAEPTTSQDCIHKAMRSATVQADAAIAAAKAKQ